MLFENEYRRKFSGSGRLFERAEQCIVGGVTMNMRTEKPFPIYVKSSSGSKKTDVDGNELIDFWMGMGALIHGHGPAPVTRAIQEQVALGTHYGSGHELEIEWAELIKKLVPNVEKVRFTHSVSEATNLAVRCAKASTNRTKIMRLHGHYHGWHDWGMTGWRAPFDRPASAGIDPASLAWLSSYPIEQLEEITKQLRTGAYAAVIMEPLGGQSGAVALPVESIRAIREATLSSGTLLIFDEAVSGFRAALGGAQERLGIDADLVTLGKILGGGLPAACLAGSAKVLDVIDPVTGNVVHNGTFNANPLSAAAGIAALKMLSKSTYTKLEMSLNSLTGMLNEVLQRRSVPGLIQTCMGSVFAVTLGGQDSSSNNRVEQRWTGYKDMRRGMLALGGVDFLRNGGMIATAHTDQDLARVAEAFDNVVAILTK